MCCIVDDETDPIRSFPKSLRGKAWIYTQAVSVPGPGLVTTLFTASEEAKTELNRAICMTESHCRSNGCLDAEELTLLYYLGLLFPF